MLAPLLVTVAMASEPTPDPSTLEARVVTLEAKVAALEAALAAQPSPRPGPTDEAAAADLFQLAVDAMTKGDVDTARLLLTRLETEQPSTRAARQAQRLQRELAVVGSTVPADWERHIETWFTKPRRFDLTRGLVVAVYWEEWCPHCKREVPEWQGRHERYAEQGLQVVGFTRLTRSSTAQGVESFIQAHDIRFPIAKEDGELARMAGVSGIPAAAVYRDGEMIWRGHPARIDDAQLQTWLAAP